MKLQVKFTKSVNVVIEGDSLDIIMDFVNGNGPDDVLNIANEQGTSRYINIDYDENWVVAPEREIPDIVLCKEVFGC